MTCLKALAGQEVGQNRLPVNVHHPDCMKDHTVRFLENYAKGSLQFSLLQQMRNSEGRCCSPWL